MVASIVGLHSLSLTDIRDVLNTGRLLWKKHALERMMERGISRNQVKQAILQGGIIEIYQYFLAGLKPRPSGRKERPQQAKRSCFLGRGLGRGCKPLLNLWLHPGRDVSLLLDF
jgi:hypothetical protein